MTTNIEGVPPHNPTGPSVYYGCASSRGISPKVSNNFGMNWGLSHFNTLIRIEGSEENN